jgi:hypothetical protein
MQQILLFSPLELSVLEDERIVDFAKIVEKAVKDGEFKARPDEDTTKERFGEAERL